MKPLSEDVRKTVTEYFDCDILDVAYGLSPSMRENIVATFTFAYNHHLSKKEINEQLKESNLSELRERIRRNNNPFPVRLGELKKKLLREAGKNKISLHAQCRIILQEYYNKKII